MSYKLNLLNGGYIGDYIGENYRAQNARSVHYGTYEG